MIKRKNRLNGLLKDTGSLLGASVLTSVGADVVVGLGGNAAGLTNIGNRLGTLGTLLGTKAVLKQTKKLKSYY